MKGAAWIARAANNYSTRNTSPASSQSSMIVQCLRNVSESSLRQEGISANFVPEATKLQTLFHVIAGANDEATLYSSTQLATIHHPHPRHSPVVCDNEPRSYIYRRLLKPLCPRHSRPYCYPGEPWYPSQHHEVLPGLFRMSWISKPSFCTPGLTMTQRPARHAERGSRNVTNSDRSVAYARRESLSVGIGNRSQRSKCCTATGMLSA